MNINKLQSIFEYYCSCSFNDYFKSKLEIMKKNLLECKDGFTVHKLVLKNCKFTEEVYKDVLSHVYYVMLKPIYNITPNIFPYYESYKYREKNIKETNKEAYIIEEEIQLKYFNITLNLEIKKKEFEFMYDVIRVFSTKRGRPRIPSYIKVQNREKNREKMRGSMNNKYEYIKNINKNLLTDEEYILLTKDIQGNKPLINKLSFFRFNSNLKLN